MGFKENIIAFFAWVKRMLEDGDGVPSSKRVQSFLLIALGVVLLFLQYPVELCVIPFTAALGLQGVTAFQR